MSFQISARFLDIENGQFAARIKVDDEAVMSMVRGESTSQLIAATRGGGLYAVSIGNKLISKETTLPKPKPQVESTQDETEVETTTEVDEGEGQRSILFEQDSEFSPAPRESSGPGITLPRAQ